MKHKGFVVGNLMVSLAILFALVATLGEVADGSALAAPLRAQPEITSVEPASAPNDVDTTITISGENFEETAVVYLWDTELVDVTWVDPTTLEAVVPWGWDPGVYDLTVENSPEEVAFKEGAFEVLLAGDWILGTIEGGNVDEIVINPLDPNIVYASSFGIGLFRSEDAGENWQIVLADGFAGALSIAPNEPNHLYLYAPWQLFHSADAGDTWEPLETPFPVDFNPSDEVPGSCCAGGGLTPYAHPEIKGTVFASVSNHGYFGSGLIKSTNYGQDWNDATEGLLDDPYDPYINDLAYHPDDPKTIVVGTGLGNLFISYNGGDTWEFLSHPMDMDFICNLEFNPLDPSELWVGGDKLIKSSDDSYIVWEEVDLPEENPYEPDETPIFERLYLSPNESGDVYITLIGDTFKWDDSEKKWNLISWGDLSQSGPVAESPVNRNVIYLGDRFFGLHKSTDGGVTWEEKNNGYTAAVPEDLSVSVKKPNIIYGAMQHTPGIYRGSNYGAMWEFLLQPDLDIQTIEADPFTPDRVFGGGFTTICRSEDGGLNWDYCAEIDLPPSLETCPNIIEVIRAHPKTQDLLLVGIRHICDDEWHYSPGSIYYTNDGGENWIQADTEGMKVVVDLAFDPVDENIAYAGTNSGFYRSENAGLSWVRMEGDPGDIVPGEMLSIAVEPARDADEAQHIVVLDGESGLIMFSSDQGSTWEEASFPSPGDNFGQLIFAPTDPPRLYAASRTGLRYSTNYGKTWMRVAGDLEYVNVISLAAVEEEDRVIIYAATPGGYAARSDRGMMTTASLGTRDDTTLVNPGVYRFTQKPTKNLYLPIILH